MAGKRQPLFGSVTALDHPLGDGGAEQIGWTNSPFQFEVAFAKPFC